MINDTYLIKDEKYGDELTKGRVDKSETSRRGMAASIGKINVRTFLSQWDNNVFQYCAEDFKSDADTLGEKMGMSVDNVKELENVCRYFGVRVFRHTFSRYRFHS